MCFGGERRLLATGYEFAKTSLNVNEVRKPPSHDVDSHLLTSALIYTAISRKVVGKSARDNPERHCGWFWIHCSSEKFERIGMKSHENVFASATRKQQK